MRTRFATGKAKLIRLDVFKQGPREIRGQQEKQAVEGGRGHPRNYEQGAGTL